MRNRNACAEVGCVLLNMLCALTSGEDQDKLKVLILDGRNNHEWQKTTPVLKQMLVDTGRFSVDVHTAPPKMQGQPDKWPIRLAGSDLAEYDCIVSNYNGPRWSPQTEIAIEEFVRGGRGVAVVHAANNCHRGWIEWRKMLGHNWRGSGHGPKFEFDVSISDVKHPITEGVTDFWHNRDELYHLLKFNRDATNAQVLATAFSPPRTIRIRRRQKDGTKPIVDHCAGTGRDEPMVVVTDYGKGRCFHMILGHFAKSMEGNGFKTLMARGVEWAATGKVSLPVIEPIRPAKNPPRYPKPQVVVEGLEQHLLRREYDRLPALFAVDGEKRSKFARRNTESVIALIRDLRIPKVRWKVSGDVAVWALPRQEEQRSPSRIECVKEGAEWKIKGVR